MTPPISNPPLQVNSPRSKPTFYYVLGLIIVALLSGGGVYIYMKYDLSITPSKTSPTPTTFTQITPTVPKNITSDWKIYKDDYRQDYTYANPIEFTYQFKYPSDWITEGRPDTPDTFWFIPIPPDGPSVMALKLNIAIIKLWMN